MTQDFSQAPDLSDIEAIATRAFAALPEKITHLVRNVTFHVQDFPGPQTMRDMELETPFDLLGLYSGLPMNQRSVGDTPPDLDRIFLYRRPLLDCWCETGEDLKAIVRNVLIHEIGHHFGLSDADMQRIEES